MRPNPGQGTSGGGGFFDIAPPSMADKSKQLKALQHNINRIPGTYLGQDY